MMAARPTFPNPDYISTPKAGSPTRLSSRFASRSRASLPATNAQRGLNVQRKGARHGYEEPGPREAGRPASWSRPASCRDPRSQARRRQGAHSPSPGAPVTAVEGSAATATSSDTNPDVGGEHRFGLTNASSTDVNPDFSQSSPDPPGLADGFSSGSVLPEKRVFLPRRHRAVRHANPAGSTRGGSSIPFVGGKFTGKFGRLGVPTWARWTTPRVTTRGSTWPPAHRLRRQLGGGRDVH